MRPAYRYTAIVLGVLLIAALAGARLLRPNATVEAEPPPISPVLGAKQGEDLEQMLDRLQAAEAERFGAEEASRRRRSREQLLDSRMKER